jgi:hypothetical protein
MKPLARSCQLVSALWAEFREEQPGSLSFSRDRRLPAWITARKVMAVPIPLQRHESFNDRGRVSPLASIAGSRFARLVTNPTSILSPLGF